MERTSKWIGIAVTVTAIGLVITGFLVPPTGVIDGSVLTAVGELLGFKAVSMLPVFAKRGTDVTLQHGDTSLTINNPDECSAGSGQQAAGSGQTH